MEILNFLVKYNIVGMVMAFIGIVGFYKYKNYDENTGKNHKKQKIAFGVVFVLGIVYLMMPLWIKLFGI